MTSKLPRHTLTHKCTSTTMWYLRLYGSKHDINGGCSEPQPIMNLRTKNATLKM